ncbi:MAG TPA: lysoplasmalogenase [Symbiobacteriaceae bacterium]|nr:lysoplasmalogenase [Symbiobacteriaceae bacterium]
MRWWLLAATLTGVLYLVPSPVGPWWGWVLKPLTTLLLIGLAAAGAPSGYRRLMLLGLLLSLAGDVFLMLPGDWFIPGLAAFLCAHIAYTVAFWRRRSGWAPWGWGVAAALLALGGFMYSQFVPALQPQGGVMLLAVAAYVVAILLMTLRAVLTGHGVIAIGAVLFLLSDAILGWNRFAAPVPLADLWIMVAYWAGQGFLACSVSQRLPSTLSGR